MITVEKLIEMLSECEPNAIAFVRFVDEKGDIKDEEMEAVYIEKAIGEAGYVILSSIASV